MPDDCKRGDAVQNHTLIDAKVNLPDTSAGWRPGRKELTLVHSMIAGGNFIDDADVLRTGSSAVVLGHVVMAPSTLGTFLRAHTFGNVRQLDSVNAEALRRAWTAGAAPDPTRPLVVDVDFTICRVFENAGLRWPHGAGASYLRPRWVASR